MTCYTNRAKYRLSFLTMIVLTLTLCLAKVFIGYKENSLSLIADSFHLTSDVAALVIGYLALRFSERKIEGRYTFGTVRAEVLGATVNAIFLVAICFSLCVESLKRLVIPDSIEHPEAVFIVGVIGLVVNATGLILFRYDSFKCYNKKEETVKDLKKFSVDVKFESSPTSCQSSRKQSQIYISCFVMSV